MYPKIIWQDVVSVHGSDRAVRVVLYNAYDGVVEWSVGRDAMGVATWSVADVWNEMTADIVRLILGASDSERANQTLAAISPTSSKIALIKLVRTATSMYAKQEPKPIGGGCMGLKDAKDLVEQFLASGGRV